MNNTYNLRILRQFVLLLLLSMSIHKPCTAADSPVAIGSPMFRPLRANIFEPRVGALYAMTYGKEGNLRLDIGNSLDMLAFPLSQQAELRFGADFFTFTRLRSEVNFRFPVETTDFFFGMNASVKTQISPELTFSSRFRLAHISAHLVDGIPKFADSSFVYSREFVDVVAALEWGSWRAYVGANVLFHSIPDNFGAVTPQLGFDVLDYSVLSSLLGENIGLTAGYDAKLVTANGVTTTAQAAQGGIRFGARRGTGIVLNLHWYNGKSMHGMFYNQQDAYWGVGFQLDF